MSQYKVAFLGLGVMGFSMAGHIARSHPTSVWNRTRAKTDQWVEAYQALGAENPTTAVDDADVVCMCLGRDEDVLSVALGEQSAQTIGTEGVGGFVTAMKQGSILIDHTTTSRECALKLAAACAKQGVDFLDAPVSGGQVGAEKGRLAIMVGGAEVVFQKAQPVLACYGKQVARMGEVGAGQVTKMVNQICIAHSLQGLSEGILLAEKAGLDVAKLLPVIGSGAAQSWQMDNHAATMNTREFDFGFALDWMIKDLSYALSQAHDLGINLDDTLGRVYRTYEQLSHSGHGREDTSALIRQFDD